MPDPPDADFLNWMVDRLVNIYHESPNVDFVHRLRQMAQEAELSTPSAWLCETRSIGGNWHDHVFTGSEPQSSAQIRNIRPLYLRRN